MSRCRFNQWSRKFPLITQARVIKLSLEASIKRNSALPYFAGTKLYFRANRIVTFSRETRKLFILLRTNKLIVEGVSPIPYLKSITLIISVYIFNF